MDSGITQPQGEFVFQITSCDVQTLSQDDQDAILQLNKKLRGAAADTSFENFVKHNLHMGQEDALLYVARDTAQVIKAVIILDVEDVSSYWIRHNVVSDDAAGHGLGTKMLQTVINQARARGAKKVSLVCNDIPSRDAARIVYTKAGFHLVDPRYTTIQAPDGGVIAVQRWDLGLEEKIANA
ncbi:MAG: Acetyltransferase domain [Candidatus Parcubacteria bacterium]|jgi:GNAT superfamily N-acetyltransferase